MRKNYHLTKYTFILVSREKRLSVYSTIPIRLYWLCSNAAPRLDWDTASSDKAAPKRSCPRRSLLRYVWPIRPTISPYDAITRK